MCCARVHAGSGRGDPLAPAQRSLRLLLWTRRDGGDRDAHSGGAPRDRCRAVGNGNAANRPLRIEPGNAALPVPPYPGSRQVRLREGLTGDALAHPVSEMHADDVARRAAAFQFSRIWRF